MEIMGSFFANTGSPFDADFPRRSPFWPAPLRGCSKRGQNSPAYCRVIARNAPKGTWDKVHCTFGLSHVPLHCVGQPCPLFEQALIPLHHALVNDTHTSQPPEYWILQPGLSLSMRRKKETRRKTANGIVSLMEMLSIMIRGSDHHAIQPTPSQKVDPGRETGSNDVAPTWQRKPRTQVAPNKKAENRRSYCRKGRGDGDFFVVSSRLLDCIGTFCPPDRPWNNWKPFFWHRAYYCYPQSRKLSLLNKTACYL